MVIYDKKHGIYIYTFSNGRKKKVEYENDKRIRIIEVIKEGKV
jgi:hypothetical protein